MHQKDVVGMAHSVDHDQTAPLAAWSGSTLFAHTCISENLESLRYIVNVTNGKAAADHGWRFTVF